MTMAKLFVSAGAPRHSSGGEIPAPSPVNSVGVAFSQGALHTTMPCMRPPPRFSTRRVTTRVLPGDTVPKSMTSGSTCSEGRNTST